MNRFDPGHPLLFFITASKTQDHPPPTCSLTNTSWSERICSTRKSMVFLTRAGCRESGPSGEENLYTILHHRYCAAWLILIFCPWTTGIAGYLLFRLMGLMGYGFVVTFAGAKEVIHPHLSGMAVRVVNTGCFIGTALMQPLFGRIVDMTWDGKAAHNIRIYAASYYHNGFIVVASLP